MQKLCVFMITFLSLIALGMSVWGCSDDASDAGENDADSDTDSDSDSDSDGCAAAARRRKKRKPMVCDKLITNQFRKLEPSKNIKNHVSRAD